MTGVDETPGAEPMRQQGQRLGGRELGADAGSRASPERQILETVAFALFGEAIDVEGVGIVPIFTMPMQQPGPYGDDVARPDFPFSEAVRPDCLQIEPRYPRGGAAGLHEGQPEPPHA